MVFAVTSVYVNFGQMVAMRVAGLCNSFHLHIIAATMNITEGTASGHQDFLAHFVYPVCSIALADIPMVSIATVVTTVVMAIQPIA